MTLTKLINGIRVQLPSDEESLKRDEWAKEDLKKEIEIQKDIEKNERKAALQVSVKSKLKSLGFTDDQLGVLINES